MTTTYRALAEEIGIDFDQLPNFLADFGAEDVEVGSMSDEAPSWLVEAIRTPID